MDTFVLMVWLLGQSHCSDNIIDYQYINERGENNLTSFFVMLTKKI